MSLTPAAQVYCIHSLIVFVDRVLRAARKMLSVAGPADLRREEATALEIGPLPLERRVRLIPIDRARTPG